MYFIFRGKKYEEAENPQFVEMAFAEGKWKADIKDWSSAQTRMTTLYMAVKRAAPGLLSWEELLTLSPNDFEMHYPELEEEDDDPAADPETWPLDPTDAVTPTELPPGYGHQISENPTTPVSSPYFDPNSSGSSPQYFDSPPAT